MKQSFTLPRSISTQIGVQAWVIILLTLVYMLFSTAQAWASAAHETTATVVNKDISTNATWTKAGSPYNVTQFVSVKAGVTLTVEAGVEVVFSQNVPMSVLGTLVTQGTANEPVIFTGATKQAGSWNGINVSNSAQQPAVLKFDHTIVEYATFVGMENNGNVNLTFANAEIRHSTFRNGGGNGLMVNSQAVVIISDSSFTNNTLEAVRFGFGTQNDPVLSNLSASGNGSHNAVVYFAGKFTVPHALEKMGLPYVFKGGMNVEETGLLTIQPGVEVQVDTGFYVKGHLSALGTADQPILITGVKKQAGGWWGLNITGDFNKVATAELDHVIIEYGGQEADGFDANLTLSSANVTITHSSIRNGIHHGIVNQGGAPEESFAVTIADSTISNNGGDALVCTDESCNMTLNNMTVTGNGRNGIVQRSYVNKDALWRNIGLPYYVEGQGGVMADSTLTIEPGVEVRMGKDADFSVLGALFANGTASQPITFTGSQAQAGWWERISVDTNGFAELRHCDISYGGGGQIPGQTVGQLHFNTGSAFVSDCRIHHSAAAGISIGGNGHPNLLYNRIEENVQGLSTLFLQKQADARYNWWGSASGPAVADNPGGTGQSITGDVLYRPWLTDRNQRETESSLEINLIAPGRFVPGDVEQYSVTYRNLTGKTIENAVVRVALPANSELQQISAGGIYWQQRNQVFWKLGNLAQGGGGAMYVKVRYDWGLSDGLKSTTVAQISGSNLTSSRFTVQPYLDYVPRTRTNSVDLTPAQAEVERTANPELAQLYQKATAAGFLYAGAERHTYSTGQVETEITLLRFQPQFANFRLSLVNGKAIGILVDGSSYTVYRGAGALRYDMQNNAWSPVANGAVPAANGEINAAALNKINEAIDWGDCMENCIAEKIPGYIIKKYIKVLSEGSKAINCVKAGNDMNDTESVLGCAKYLKKVVPGVSEAIDLGQCNLDCQTCEESGMGCSNPLCHCCTEDSYRCDSGDFIYGTFGIDVIKRRKCVIEEGEEAGKYLAEVVETVCALCEKCINNGSDMACVAKNGGFILQAIQVYAAALSDQHATAEVDSISSSDLECDECQRAKDPNELYGPEGDLLPGQLLTYTIAYENVGVGNAFGVFVMDKLDPAFDLNTIQLFGNATLSKNARTLFWEIGELAPKGQAGSSGTVSFTVKLRTDLPSGTMISNQAVVHFPSVPEETPTNVLVNTIQPLIAEPQTLEATIGQPLVITLQGRDAIGSPLTYTIVEAPDFGTLSGTAPALVYTPAEQSVGGDRIVFTVSNGVSTSAEGVISIRVSPSANDQKAPSVVWTAPTAGETVQLIEAAALANGQAPLYYPVIQVQFSEALQSTTVTNTTILVSAGGQAMAADVRYEGNSQQAILMLRQQPQAGVEYTVTVTTGVKDLRGNPIANAHAWSFKVAGASNQPSGQSVFLPLVSR